VRGSKTAEGSETFDKRRGGGDPKARKKVLQPSWGNEMPAKDRKGGTQKGTKGTCGARRGKAVVTKGGLIDALLTAIVMKKGGTRSERKPTTRRGV